MHTCITMTFGKFTSWRLIVSQQRKIAHDTLNKLLQNNNNSTQNTLYWAIQMCYDNDLINYEAKELLEKINNNGNIARHQWEKLSEDLMNFDNIVYINSIFSNTSFKPNHTDESCAAELKQILEHRDLIHILRENDLSEEGSFMDCLNKLKNFGLITDEQYNQSKAINKEGCKSKHPNKKKNKKNNNHH